MQLHDGRVLISASDLMAFLECEHVTALDFLALGPGGEAMVRAKADESAELVARKGIEHEHAYLARLRDNGLHVVEIGGDGESLRDKEETTLQAMRAGADVVYQATLRQDELLGHADFLVKVSGRASVLGDWSYALTTDRWDHYSVVQSTLHEVWARKYSGALKQDLRYSPSNCFETFPFPEDLWQTADPALAQIGEHYHEHRRRLMRELWLGLTDIYNLFHASDLSPELVGKVSKKPADVARVGFHGLLELRRLHVALDNAVRDAYGWTDLNLGHDFFDVEALPENDRVRCTISPSARKEVLKRLLALNHQRAKEETAKKTLAKPRGTGRNRAATLLTGPVLFEDL